MIYILLFAFIEAVGGGGGTQAIFHPQHPCRSKTHLHQPASQHHTVIFMDLKQRRMSFRFRFGLDALLGKGWQLQKT